MKDVFWVSPAPKKCVICNAPITKKFYDGATTSGPWACMCPSCFYLGPGLGKLGTGLGQEFTKQADGRWKKTGG